MGLRVTGHIRIAGDIYGNRLRLIVGSTSEVCRIEQSGSRRIDFGYKSIPSMDVSAAENRLHGIRCRQIVRSGSPGNVGISCRIDSESHSLIIPASAKVCGVDNRINNKRFRVVVCA